MGKLCGTSSEQPRSPRVTRSGEEIEPIFYGLATWYQAREGAITKSGQPYSRSADACAVDLSEWKRLTLHRLLVIGSAGWGYLKANDTGYLYRAGQWELDTRWGSRRWWPSKKGLRIVADLPEQTFWRIFKTRDTQVVWIFDLGD